MNKGTLDPYALNIQISGNKNWVPDALAFEILTSKRALNDILVIVSDGVRSCVTLQICVCHSGFHAYATASASRGINFLTFFTWERSTWHSRHVTYFHETHPLLCVRWGSSIALPSLSFSQSCEELLFSSLNLEFKESTREKKQMFSLIHKLANRWRTVSKLCFVYISSPSDAP